MDVSVVGFEGGMSSPASWGAAAFSKGNGIYNSVTKRFCTTIEFETLVSKNSVSSIEPVVVYETAFDSPCVLLRIFSRIDIDTKMLEEHSMNGWKEGKQSYWLFRNFNKFQMATESVADVLAIKVILQIMSGERNEETDEALSVISTLQHRHPELNAILASFGNSQFAKEFYGTLVLAKHKDRFDRCLKALQLK